MTTFSRYVILDRDGTLIREKNYLSNPDDVELLPGAIAGLQRMRAMGLGLVVITNQAGINRGYFTHADLVAVHTRMSKLLADAGIVLDGIYYCPHRPDEDCPCRKPRLGLLEKACADLKFDPRPGFVIGDKASDVAMGHAAGARSILVRTGYGAELEADKAKLAEAAPDAVVDDLEGAAGIIAGWLK